MPDEGQRADALAGQREERVARLRRVAERLAGDGFRVVVHYHLDRVGAEALPEVLQALRELTLRRALSDVGIPAAAVGGGQLEADGTLSEQRLAALGIAHRPDHRALRHTIGTWLTISYHRSTRAGTVMIISSRHVLTAMLTKHSKSLRRSLRQRAG